MTDEQTQMRGIVVRPNPIIVSGVGADQKEAKVRVRVSNYLGHEATLLIAAKDEWISVDRSTAKLDHASGTDVELTLDLEARPDDAEGTLGVGVRDDKETRLHVKVVVQATAPAAPVDVEATEFLDKDEIEESAPSEQATQPSTPPAEQPGEPVSSQFLTQLEPMSPIANPSETAKPQEDTTPSRATQPKPTEPEAAPKSSGGDALEEAPVEMPVEDLEKSAAPTAATAETPVASATTREGPPPASTPSEPPPSSGAPNLMSTQPKAESKLPFAQIPILSRLSPRVQHWSLYLAGLAGAVVGLAFFMWFVALFMADPSIKVIPPILGVLGAAGVGAAFYLLDGRQAPIDRIEEEQEGQPLDDLVEEPRISSLPLHLGLTAFLAVVGLVGGMSSSPFANDTLLGVLGLISGLLLGLACTSSEALSFLNGPMQRRFDPRHLIRPVAAGIGVIGLAVALGLFQLGDWLLAEDWQIGQDWEFEIGNIAEERVLNFVVLALVGMIGIGGGALRQLPLRIQQWIGKVQPGLVTGALVVVTASVGTMLLYSPGDQDLTVRFGYTPAFIAQYAREEGVILASLMALAIVGLGALGTLTGMHAFGAANLIQDRKALRQRVILMVTVFVLMGLVMLPIWAVVALLPLGVGFEGWVLGLIPAAFLTWMLILLRRRPTGFNWMMLRFQGLIKPLKFLPIHKPLDKLSRLRADDVRPLVTWQIGWLLVVVGGLLAAPLALSIVWGLLVTVIVVGVLEYQERREARPQAPSAPPQEAPPPNWEQNTGVSPEHAPPPRSTDQTMWPQQEPPPPDADKSE